MSSMAVVKFCIIPDLNQNIQINTDGAKRNVQIGNSKDQEMGNVKEKKEQGFFERQV
jgi:hypothetical protein